MKRLVVVTGLVLAVTVGGVMAGALLVSPLAASKPWVIPTVAGIAIVAVMAMLMVWMQPVTSGPAVRIASPPSPSRAALSQVSQAKSHSQAMPSLSFGRAGFSLGGKADRTPKAVHALAAAGTTLTEIARRTGLPVDAVTLVLAISAASRQLQPPTA
jgi:hypothetical protein